MCNYSITTQPAFQHELRLYPRASYGTRCEPRPQPAPRWNHFQTTDPNPLSGCGRICGWQEQQQPEQQPEQQQQQPSVLSAWQAPVSLWGTGTSVLAVFYCCNALLDVRGKHTSKAHASLAARRDDACVTQCETGGVRLGRGVNTLDSCWCPRAWIHTIAAVFFRSKCLPILYFCWVFSLRSIAQPQLCGGGRAGPWEEARDTLILDGVPAEAMTDMEHGCWGFPGQLLWKSLSRLEITASSWLVVSVTQRSTDRLELFTKPRFTKTSSLTMSGCFEDFWPLRGWAAGRFMQKEKRNKLTNVREGKRRNLRAKCRGGIPLHRAGASENSTVVINSSMREFCQSCQGTKRFVLFPKTNATAWTGEVEL